MDLKEKILRFALQNAVQFNGKANPGAVIGKLIAEDDSLKKDMKFVSKEVQAVMKDVNKMPVEEQKKKLEELAPEMLEKKKGKKRDLPELDKAEMGKVVTRIPPEPSKYSHIGHALSFIINYMYAKKYKGKCILRFEDTNPAAVSKEYVDAIKEDVIGYLDIKPSKIMFASDDLEKMYKLAEKLIKAGKAYVCFCERDKMRDLRHKGECCECRNVKDCLDDWKNMLKGKYKEGECVLRLKGDLQSENHVMRDPVIFRICTEEHFMHKKKYHVWPMYDFENAVEDGLHGVTHIMRSIEFGEMRVELQEFLKDLLGMEKQVVVQYGRFNVVGATTQGREIRKLIEDGGYLGWDDPRLVTLKALKRRGFVKETLYELAVQVGLSTTPTNIDWSIISAANRKILDPTCNRHFFIDDAEEITIKGAPTQDVEIKLHPEHPERGTRKFKTDEKFYISKRDIAKMKSGELVRLMDCLNFKKNKGYTFDSVGYEDYKDKGKLIIHWLPKETVKVEIMMPDAKIKKGIAESSVKDMKEGDIVQFVRFGFCRLDKKEKDKLTFWFAHE
ncbi:MAG: glutamate--tRNA ligase [bacterium]|nr:glutamate--tRNA ligase [bacterium]